MANYGRSTYEPHGDDVHVFDGSEDDEDAEGSRLPILIVIALFVLASFAGVVWLAYTQGVARGRSDVPRVIAAQPGPAKVAAVGDQGAGATPFKGLKIYQQPALSDEEADRQSAPPPSSAGTKNQTAAVAPETALVAVPKAEPAAEKEPPLSVAKSIAPPVIKKAIVASPAPEATAPPAQLGANPAVAAPGAYVLQIGAYKSAEDADAAWRTYQSKHAGLLAGQTKDVKRVDLGGKGVWYRLRLGSFAGKDAAKALCDRLTAQGGACFPSK